MSNTYFFKFRQSWYINRILPRLSEFENKYTKSQIKFGQQNKVEIILIIKILGSIWTKMMTHAVIRLLSFFPLVQNFRRKGNKLDIVQKLFAHLFEQTI